MTKAKDIFIKDKMIILGVNETSHDASVSLIKDGEILFAGHAERYSKQKNDWYINDSLIKDALQYGTPDNIAYYEKPLLKASRLALRGGAGEWKPRFELPGIPKNLLVIIIHTQQQGITLVNLIMLLL